MSASSGKAAKPKQMLTSFNRDYLRALAAAFLVGTAATQLSLFAVVLRRHDLAPSTIAAVLMAAPIAMILAPLCAGTVATRYGAVWTIRLGMLVSVIAIAALPFTVTSPAAAAIAMLGRGAGMGLVMPAGQLLAQSQAGEGDGTRAVGVFSAMVFLPSFFGPALAEWTLGHWGEGGFFLLATLPALAALAVVCLLSQIITPAAPNASGYLALVRDRRLWLPNLATMQSGLGYTLPFSFLPILLVETGVKVAMFFTPFAVALVLVRFVGLKYLQRMPPAVLVACGVFAYATGLYNLTAIGASAAFAPFCGVLFAFGYGVVMPSCITWSTSRYPQAERARQVALINTSFSLGSLAALGITGAGLNVIGWSGVLVILGTIVTGMFLVLVGHLIASSLRPQASVPQVHGAHE